MVVGKASGLTTRSRVFRHALKNALIPIVTLMGWELGRLLSAYILLVESVFNWPGIGLLVIQAIENRDLPIIEADVFIVALLTVTLNFALDIVYMMLDPRIRTTHRKLRAHDSTETDLFVLAPRGEE
jgi:peptide/nickel transport system permease protein